MKSTEKDTQEACLQTLDAFRIFHYRQNTGGFKDGRGKFYRFGSPGAPDIIAVIRGIYVGIEVKDIKGKLNDNQERFKASLEAAGGIYLTIRSIDELLAFLKNNK